MQEFMRDEEIEITLNGQSKKIGQSWTVSDLVKALGLREDQVAVELDQVILKRRLWGESALRGGERIEIVHFVGGGSPLWSQS